jgi:hypothetical protein
VTITAPPGSSITNNAHIGDADLIWPAWVVNRTTVSWRHTIYLPVLQRAP